MEDTLVKVIEVSSVNLSLLHAEDKKRIYGSYETFLNEKPREIDIQIARISQPVNLKSYYNMYKEKFDGDVTADHAKRCMQKGYLQHIEQIQKSKNMVTQKTVYHHFEEIFGRFERKGIAGTEKPSRCDEATG
ncbi:hypothetical protein ACT7C6_32945 [Bacillus paranthracis]